MNKVMMFFRRMREMFKPSMAELGLCMYQVYDFLLLLKTIQLHCKQYHIEMLLFLEDC